MTNEEFCEAVSKGLMGARLTKSQFIVLVREAACRLGSGEFRAGWLEATMAHLNSIMD